MMNTFWPEEAEIILNIPVSKRGGEDKLIWGLHNKALFTVESSYQTDIKI